MVKIYTLASGSSGNATYIRCGDTELLIDAGISRREIDRKLTALGSSLSHIAAIFITHEHSDHIKGIEMLSKYDHIPLYGAKTTLTFMKKVNPDLFRFLNPTDAVTFGEVTVTPFPTSHDTPESYGYTVNYHGERFGLCTDLGRPTDAVTDALYGCRAVILEANYDAQMLKYGNYPPFLKERIASDYGHLDNRVSAKFAAFLAKSGTERILLAHLSQENNTPDCAFDTVNRYLQEEKLPLSLAVASRSEITELITYEC